jgi:hypothetical protein
MPDLNRAAADATAEFLQPVVGGQVIVVAGQQPILPGNRPSCHSR